MNRHQRRAAAKSQRLNDEDDPTLLAARARQAISRGNAQEAAAVLRKLVKLQPTDGGNWRALGQASASMGDGSAAVAAFAKAVELDATNTAVWADLASAQQAQGLGEKAMESLRSIIAIDPAFPGALFNLAGTLKEQGRLEEAVDLTRMAVERDPGDAAARFNLSLLLLTLGRYEEGWDAYEARLRIPGFDVHTGFPQPQWDGCDIPGKTLLVHAEQGLGDIIQFARYLPLLKGRAKRVLFAVPHVLTGLFQNLPGVDDLLTADDPPVRILSRFDGCWRWLRNREDSPWYPTARLFRQATPGDWASVISRVAEALTC